MRTIRVDESCANQRLDKLLFKLMNRAPKNFVYQMLRKKNITLNGRKAAGKEIVQTGDVVTLFLSDATIAGFQLEKAVNTNAGPLDIIFEDEQVLFCDKPAGVLCQKGKAADNDTMNDRILAYLSREGRYSPGDLFTPALCNRLDRNTSGIVLCGKTLAAASWLSAALAGRLCEKRYMALVSGNICQAGTLRASLQKDEAGRKAILLPGEPNAATHYRPLKSGNAVTLVELIITTGRFHQIRAQLASVGHPVAGDAKYGDDAQNKRFRRIAGVERQMLHAEGVCFTKEPGVLAYLSGKQFAAPLPEDFQKACEILLG